MLYYLTTDTLVEPLLSKGYASGQVPYWHLADRCIWIGDFRDVDELESLAVSSRGSWSWLGDAVDTILFAKETCLLHSVALSLPDSVHLVSRHFYTADYLADKGSLLLSSETKNFRIDSCNTSAYSLEDDMLFLIASDSVDTFAYDFALTIFADFSILFYKRRYVGWMLQQASCYLISDAGPHQSYYETSTSKKSALHRYFGYFNEEVANRMEEEDPVVKKELMVFLAELDQKHDPQFASIREGIANLLDGYL